MYLFTTAARTQDTVCFCCLMDGRVSSCGRSAEGVRLGVVGWRLDVYRKMEESLPLEGEVVEVKGKRGTER